MHWAAVACLSQVICRPVASPQTAASTIDIAALRARCTLQLGVCEGPWLLAAGTFTPQWTPACRTRRGTTTQPCLCSGCPTTLRARPGSWRRTDMCTTCSSSVNALPQGLWIWCRTPSLSPHPRLPSTLASHAATSTTSTTRLDLIRDFLQKLQWKGCTLLQQAAILAALWPDALATMQLCSWSRICSCSLAGRQQFR